MKKSKKKKMKTAEADEEAEPIKEDNPNAVSKFKISEPLKNALKAKGIEALFPIQARTFESIYDGLDLIGKAKTGQVLGITFRNLLYVTHILLGVMNKLLIEMISLWFELLHNLHSDHQNSYLMLITNSTGQNISFHPASIRVPYQWT